jgi:hypothetical protein
VFFATHNFRALFADNIKLYSETAHLDADFKDFNIVSELSQTVFVKFSNAFLTGSTSVACFTMTVQSQTRAVVAIPEYFLISFRLSDNFCEFLEIVSNFFEA